MPTLIRTIDGIVEKTGGDVLKGDEVGDHFRQMIRRLRRRYALHFAMPEAKPGAQRTIKVELTPEAARRFPGAMLRARSGYIVPQR